MSEHDNDQANLEAAEQAVAQAKTSAIRTDLILDRLRKTRAEINSAVEPNGYVSRFREILRGA